MITLYDQWRWINNVFFDISDLTIIKAAGVYTQIYNRTLVARGFGVPRKSVLLRDARIELLYKRYVDWDLWKKCVKRFESQPKGNSHTFLFNRTEGPKAGGCLLSIVLIRKPKKQCELMITSRAEEVTMALLADIHFVRRVMEGLEATLEIDFDLDNIPIKWHMGVAYQNRTFVPVFVYDTSGASGLHKWLRPRKTYQNEWEKICVEHSRRMIKQSAGITGARLLWGKRLKEWTK